MSSPYTFGNHGNNPPCMWSLQRGLSQCKSLQCGITDPLARSRACGYVSGGLWNNGTSKGMEQCNRKCLTVAVNEAQTKVGEDGA